jgi:transcription initiation factor TFIIIB Brf1 subunit/transcription initiation factor TFIIB
LRCPYCGSTKLVWDSETGYLVCGSCGTIIEPLFDNTPTGAFLPVHRPPLIIAKPKPTQPRKDKKIHINRKNKKEKENKYIEKIKKKYILLINQLNINCSPRLADALSYYLALREIGFIKKYSLIVTSNKYNISKKYIEKNLRLLTKALRNAQQETGE